MPVRDVITRPNSNNITMFLFTILIIGLAIYFYRKFTNETNEIGHDLASMKELLSSVNRETIIYRYEEIHSRLSSSPIIGSSWSEYDKTLVKIQKDDGSQEIFSTVETNYFISSSGLLSSRLDLDLYGSVPGLFTGLGIFGTFLGLTIGLGQIDLGSSDVEVIKDGIKNLLGGMSTAFATSLWGLALAIPFSLVQKKKLNRLKDEINSFQVKLDSLFIRKSPEAWLAESLEEARRQTRELKTFNTDLAMSIGDVLDTKLNQSLGPTFTKLLDAITELTSSGASKVAESISAGAGKELSLFSSTLVDVQNSLTQTVRDSQDITKQTAKEFEDRIKLTAETMSSMFGQFTQQQANSTATSVEQTEAMFRAMHANMQITQNQFAESSAKSNADMTGSIAVASDSLAKVAKEFEERMKVQTTNVDEVTTKLSQSVQSAVGDVAKTFKNTNEQLEAVLNSVNSLVMETKNLINEAGIAADKFRSAAEPVQQSSKMLQSSLQSLQEAQVKFNTSATTLYTKLGDTVKVTGDSAALISNSLQQTQTSWAAYETKFGVLRKDLEGVFETLHKGLQDYQSTTSSGLHQNLTTFSNEVAKAINLLSSGIEELGEVLSSFEDAAATSDRNRR